LETEVTDQDPQVMAGDVGLSVPIPADYTPAAFQHMVRTKLLRDAINTLTRLNRPLVFELFFEPEKGVAGWRA
jgi:hypothetical protein